MYKHCFFFIILNMEYSFLKYPCSSQTKEKKQERGYEWEADCVPILAKNMHAAFGWNTVSFIFYRIHNIENLKNFPTYIHSYKIAMSFQNQ